MAGGFLRNLFAPSSTPTIEEARTALASLGTERRELAEQCTLIGDLVAGLFQSADAGAVPAMRVETARAKLASEIPLLRGETFAINTRGLAKRWRFVAQTLVKYRDDPAATKLLQAERAGRLDPAEWLKEVVAGRFSVLHEQAAALDLDAALAGTVLRLAGFPTLARMNGELSRLRENVHWERGFCPTCGNAPLLGEFRGLEQTRYLRCGWCAGEWEFPRLRCPFCDNTNHRQLGFLHLEGEEARHRAATCDGCRGYVKMVSVLAPLSVPMLLVTDVATLHLDLAAAEHGYGPGL